MYHIPIPDVEQCVARPIIDRVVRDVLEKTGLSGDMTILYPGESQQPFQAGSDLASGLDGDKKNRFKGTSKIEIEVSEVDEASRIRTSPIFYPDQPCFFACPELETVMYPVVFYKELTIEFKMRFRDKNAARKWRDNLMAQMKRDFIERLHTLTYSYGIPMYCLERIKAVYELSEAQGGTGIDWMSWFSKYSSQRVQQVTDVVGNNPGWVVAERQVRTLGYFDWDIPVYESREDEPTGWVASFSYHVKYDKPVQVAIMYPNVVHNQIMPEKYRNTERMDEVDKGQYSGAASTLYYKAFDASYIRSIVPTAGDRIPYWDEFIPKTKLPSTCSILLTLNTITPTDLRTLVDFSNLGDRKLMGIILDFIRDFEAPYIQKPIQSVLNVTVYQDNEMLDASLFSVNGTTVTANVDLDITKTYRVCLSVYSDWTILTKPAIERLRQNGMVVMALLCYLGYAVCRGNQGIYSNRKSILDLSWFWKYFEYYNTTIIPQGKMKDLVDETNPYGANSDQAPVFFTVGTFMIYTPRGAINDPDAMTKFDNEWYAAFYPDQPPNQLF